MRKNKGLPHLLLILLVLSPQVDASQHKAPDFKLSAKLKGSLLEILATPPEHYHFNLKAPMTLVPAEASEALRPTLAQEQEVRFQIVHPKTTDYSITLYLCDDAQSFCEKHQMTARWNAITSLLHSQPTTSDTPHESKTTSEGLHTDKFGFIMNDSREALAQARNTKTPLLIDFFGIWCPPCNELDEEVFSSSEFKVESTHFIKPKMDSDLEASWSLKSRYKVGAYPTIIFASSEGEEISRIAGFRNKETFLKMMKEAWTLRTRPWATLIADAKKGDREAIDHLGLAHLERNEYTEAKDQLKNSKLYREQYFEAVIGDLRGKSKKGNSKNKLIQALEASLKEFPNTLGSIQRRSELAKIYEEQGKLQVRNRYLAELIETAKTWINTPSKLTDFGYSIADLWVIIAEAQETLGDFKLAKESWGHAASEYQSKISSGKERGYHLELAYCLLKSGNFEAADKIYTQFEHYFPEEFTFYYRHASLKQEQKNYVEMEKLAKKAFQFSYGDNRLRAAYLVSQAIKLQGRKLEALKTIQEVLQTVELPTDESIRTHRDIKRLQDLEKELKTST